MPFTPKVWNNGDILTGSSLTDLETRLSTYADTAGTSWVPSVKDGSIDLTTSLQSAIDTLGTGTLDIPTGTYMVNGVYVTSGVTLRMANGVIFKAPVTAPAFSSMFILATKSNTSTTYAVDLGMVGGPWTIDVTPPGAASIHCAMRVTNARRFLVENLHVSCTTVISGTIVLAPNNAWQNNTVGGGQLPLVPREGIFRNISSDGNARGGGTIQNGSGIDIKFERIASIGGVALRFETDQTPGGTAYGLIENNSGDTISCDLGNDAIHFATHGQTIKNIHISRVRATGCEKGVYFGPSSGVILSDVIIDGVHVDGTGSIANDPITGTTEGIRVESGSTAYMARCVVRSAVVENITGTAYGQSNGLVIDIDNFNVKRYGATGDGTTDDTAAIQRAAADWVIAQRGVLYFPAGHYKVSAANLLVMNYPGMSIEGDGQSSTFIEPTSAVTGDVIRWNMNPWTVVPAGKISGLTIEGTNAAAGACGLHVGDLLSHCLDNVVVSQFDKTGSVGIHVDNVTHWTEKLLWTNVFVRWNKIGVLFNVTSGSGATTSWGYNRIASLWITTFGTQSGIVFKNGGVFYSGELHIVGNIADTAIGLDIQDTCTVNCNWSVAMESAHTTATGLKIASGAHLKGTGYIDFANGITTNTNLGANNINFGGWFNCPGILSGESIATIGPAPIFFGGVNIGYSTRKMSSGTGAPGFVAVTGDFFFRGDTPSVANQRIYVCTNGAAGTWVGIV